MESGKQTITAQELQQLLAELPEWAQEGDKIVRFWTFADFVEAMAFVNRVAAMAEEVGHHPDVDIRYNRVKLALTSHDAGGITARDVSFARRLSAA